MISLASSGPPPNLEEQPQKKKDWLKCKLHPPNYICFHSSSFLQVKKLSGSYHTHSFFQFLGTIWRFPLLHSHLLTFNSLPLHWVFLEKAGEQRACLWAERAGKADVFHEDELKQLFMVLVVKRQPATHHLVHHHAKTPPVHSTAIVVVLQHLRGRGKRLITCSCWDAQKRTFSRKHLKCFNCFSDKWVLFGYQRAVETEAL